jgi:signal transduction histidine kinase
MHVAPINRKITATSKIANYRQSKRAIPQYLHALYAYLLTIPVVGLCIKSSIFVWRLFAFIISGLAGKMVSRPQKEGKASVVATKEKSSISHENIPEMQIKDRFLVMASHELKTPMTTILGHTQFMLRRLARMPELSNDLLAMRSGLESINGQAHRLNTMLDDLLDLYNIRAGKVPLHMASCNLIAICREVVAEQSLLSGRTIEMGAPLEPVTLQADSDRLYQVAVNLIGNALKYSRKDTPVKVLVDQRRDIGIMEITDNGIGISKDQQRRIFEPFYRSPEVQTTSTSGMGLGLAICKDIVEHHDGRIWCRSRLGKGSTFIVELPLKQGKV